MAVETTLTPDLISAFNKDIGIRSMLNSEQSDWEPDQIGQLAPLTEDDLELLERLLPNVSHGGDESPTQIAHALGEMLPHVSF